MTNERGIDMNSNHQSWDDHRKFVKFMERERRLLGYTKLKMAEKLKMSYSMYLKITADKRRFPVTKLHMLADLVMLNPGVVYREYYNVAEGEAVSVDVSFEYYPELAILKATDKLGDEFSIELTDDQQDVLSGSF